MKQATFVHNKEQYIVYSPTEIMQIMTDLMKQKMTLTASFNHGADFYLTTVIAIDAKNQTVHLDIGRDDNFNRRLLASDRVLFSKEDGIKINWTSTHISLDILKDGPAIKIALPQELIRLQRRDLFRIATPIVNPVTCRITLIDKANPVTCRITLIDKANPDIEKMLELTLHDVSMGGIGVIALDPLDPVLAIGVSFDNCKISFPGVGDANLTLKVKNITSVHAKNGAVKHRIGLQYVEPSYGNEDLINRYFFILQRQAMDLVNR